MLEAQVCDPPALTARKAPAGADVRPEKSSPQHATAPDVLNPQPWYVPVVTELKVPSGGTNLGSRWSYRQQSRVPVVLTPQVCEGLVLTALKVPNGAGMRRP